MRSPCARRHEHRHAEVFERAGVAVAAQLHPEVVDAELRAVALGPEEVRAAFVHRDDGVVGARRARPTRACPTRPSRTARACACSDRRRASSTRGRCGRGARAMSCTTSSSPSAVRAAVDGLGERKRTVTPEEASELGVVLHGGTECSLLRGKRVSQRCPESETRCAFPAVRPAALLSKTSDRPDKRMLLAHLKGAWAAKAHPKRLGSAHAYRSPFGSAPPRAPCRGEDRSLGVFDSAICRCFALSMSTRAPSGRCVPCDERLNKGSITW